MAADANFLKFYFRKNTFKVIFPGIEFYVGSFVCLLHFSTVKLSLHYLLFLLLLFGNEGLIPLKIWWLFLRLLFFFSFVFIGFITVCLVNFFYPIWSSQPLNLLMFFINFGKIICHHLFLIFLQFLTFFFL